ncbi:helix-turn-helix domain-containing protein [Bradyrhizobium uaiense]|uniref:Helix-turn-helix transcriptional regulator n=1 Tax=Bradyrhizobium uaiense TaxID=2594946 RepID=A0A6P1BTM0_9BRAD|nr:AraC family transcriptional regulator [Bradyrhizobium uaiense]NEV01041.1 helix-turn-helix transcriptional regulator [Bradyrhizobium uaiense]
MPSTDDRAPSSPALDDQRLRRVMQFIDANLHNPIRLKDLADVANLSPFHFARAFRKATGESPHRFVRGCRLEKAKQLLIEGNETLAEVSLICNFSSQSSFTRAFTRAFGAPPGAFRKNGKGRR